MSQPASNQDFTPQPSYSENVSSNKSWVVFTFTKTEPSGTTTQTSKIIPKR